jgi:hypothetical protein
MSRHRQEFELQFPEPTFTIPAKFDLHLVRDTQKQFNLSGLFAAGSMRIGETLVTERFLTYNFGVSRWRGSASVLWLANTARPEFQTAIIQQFDPITGLSLDQDFIYLHDLYKENFGIDVGPVETHILLGAHLAFRFPSKPIVILRHPIDLLVASEHIRDFVFLATADFDFVDLSDPRYTNCFPGTAIIILLAVEKDEARWSETAEKLDGLYAPIGRRVLCINASSLPHYTGSLAALFLDYAQDVKTLIQNL